MTTTFLNLPPHLLPSSTPPLSGTPSGQNTSTPPHSTALWYPQWTKYLFPSSTPPLSGAPSDPHPALWRPKWCSLAPQVALSHTQCSGASRGNLHCSLAPLAETPTKIPIIYYLPKLGKYLSISHSNFIRCSMTNSVKLLVSNCGF